MTSPARYLHLQLTERCNLACPGCYLPERVGPGQPAAVLDARVFAPLAASGVRYATLTGGEPLLHPEWLEACRLAARRFEDVQLVTNGLLLDVARYEALRDAGLRAIKVSLDGPDAATHDALRGLAGAFGRTTDNLRSIAALPPGRRGDIDLGCICTVHRANVGRLLDVAALADEIGLDSVLFQPYHPFCLLYPPDGSAVARPEAGADFLDELDRQIAGLVALRRERPGFLDNSLEMLGRFRQFHTRPQGPEQTCGADRFVFVNSALEVRGCLFCRPLGGLEAGLEGLRAGAAWRGFDSFRAGCERCLMGCQFVDRAQDLAEAGFAHLAAEEFEQARAAFDASLGMEFTPTAGHGAGLARLRLDDPAGALPLLKAALGHDPRNRHMLGDLAETLLALRAWEEMDAALARLAALPGGLARARMLSGFKRLEQGDPAGAREDFDAALALEFKPATAHGAGLSRLRLGDAAGARPLLELALEHNPRDRFILGDLGDAHVRLGEWEAVLGLAARLEAVPGGRVKACQHRGFEAKRRGDLPAAVELLREFMQGMPEDDPWPKFDYGLACLQAGHFAEAERFIRRASELDPGFPWFRFRLAQALRGLGRRDEALAACREALRLDPGQQAFRDLLAELEA